MGLGVGLGVTEMEPWPPTWQVKLEQARVLYLWVALALVEGVELPDIRIGEALPLAELALVILVSRNYGLLPPRLNKGVATF